MAKMMDGEKKEASYPGILEREAIAEEGRVLDAGERGYS